MSALTSNISKSMTSRCGNAVRCFSSIEQIAAGLDKVQRHRKVIQKSSMPTTFSQTLPSGKDLYVAANMCEIQALSGMPAEHQRRTVVIAPRLLKTMQSGECHIIVLQIMLFYLRSKILIILFARFINFRFVHLQINAQATSNITNGL